MTRCGACPQKNRSRPQSPSPDAPRLDQLGPATRRMLSSPEFFFPLGVAVGEETPNAAVSGLPPWLRHRFEITCFVPLVPTAAVSAFLADSYFQGNNPSGTNSIPAVCPSGAGPIRASGCRPLSSNPEAKAPAPSASAAPPRAPSATSLRPSPTARRRDLVQSARPCTPPSPHPPRHSL